MGIQEPETAELADAHARINLSNLDHLCGGCKLLIKPNRTEKIATFCVLAVVTVILGLVLSQWLSSNSLYGPQLSPEGTEVAKVKVGSEVFTFDPTKVETVRSDLFNPVYFSMFDVLAHLDKHGTIELEYHFDASMNTYVIDSIDGEPYWWYEAYYDGGWPENNVFRIDHYPWKDGTTLKFFKMDSSRLENIYSVFSEEVQRRKNSGARLVIPKVIIRGRTFTKEFENAEVTPHNMRNDIFRENVTTALDVIMSLGDQGKITYELKWYESIGTANIVKDYWVETIDEDKAYGRCGFVYEAGSLRYKGFTGNHIHLPTDIRVLNSPEYVEFFWICI